MATGLASPPAVFSMPVATLDREHFGVRLQEIREAAGLSISKVAERSNGAFSQPYYSQWESGQHLPSALLLPALANALGCTLEDLYIMPRHKRKPPKRGRPKKVEED